MDRFVGSALDSRGAMLDVVVALVLTLAVAIVVVSTVTVAGAQLARLRRVSIVPVAPDGDLPAVLPALD